MLPRLVTRAMNRSVHPSILYYKCPDCPETVRDEYICITPDLKHDSAAVHTFQEEIENVCKVKVSRNIYQSDGCSSQYKSIKPFYRLSNMPVHILLHISSQTNTASYTNNISFSKNHKVQTWLLPTTEFTGFFFFSVWSSAAGSSLTVWPTLGHFYVSLQSGIFINNYDHFLCPLHQPCHFSVNGT